MNWVIALTIFTITYIILFSEKIDRTIVTLAGALSILLTGIAFGFYSQPEAFAAIDFDTIALVLGMMIMVGTVQRTGLIEFLSIIIAQKSRGRVWLLLLGLGAFTAVASAVMDNVTTMVIVAPTTLSITDLLGLSPIPFLISESMLSIVGGMSTLIGAPPNVMIGSAADLSFTQFVTHLGPIAVVVWLLSVLYFWFKFKNTMLSTTLEKQTLEEMDPARTVENWNDVKKAIGVLIAVIALYLIHGMIGLEPQTVAFIGATLALVSIRPDVKETLADVEWGVLLFYGSLFVLVGGLEQAGIIHQIAREFGLIAENFPLLAPLILIWLAGILSGIIDNVPLTIALIPVIQGLGSIHGIHLTSYWWALALGAVLGGISSPIGSSANVITVSLSERTNNPITFTKWLKVGVPLTVLNLTLASIFLFFGMQLGYM
ncbi:ArsB/NhaD family transporter [Candidatus Bipolaricaulota bacterium]|nr:ArsB/NhaD family transporter [Candidatus Bipolaricaulota bacterium]